MVPQTMSTMETTSTQEASSSHARASRSKIHTPGTSARGEHPGHHERRCPLRRSLGTTSPPPHPDGDTGSDQRRECRCRRQRRSLCEEDPIGDERSVAVATSSARARGSQVDGRGGPPRSSATIAASCAPRHPIQARVQLPALRRRCRRDQERERLANSRRSRSRSARRQPSRAGATGSLWTSVAMIRSAPGLGSWQPNGATTSWATTAATATAPPPPTSRALDAPSVTGRRTTQPCRAGTDRGGRRSGCGPLQHRQTPAAEPEVAPLCTPPRRSTASTRHQRRTAASTRRRSPDPTVALLCRSPRRRHPRQRRSTPAAPTRRPSAPLSW